MRRPGLLLAIAASLLIAGLAAAQTAPRRAPEGTLTVAYHTFAKEVLDPGSTARSASCTTATCSTT